ncbi:MAG: ABC transporter permease [Candidatus Marinimicrobia bacterium]|nr:ABC transporter permease [Candidatus Neomarinimicrobiota bacterium]
MLRNYLISTLRRLRRAKGFTAINIIGLSVGLTGAVLVLLLVQYELGFDQHNDKLDSLHIVINRVARPGGSDRHSPNVPMPLAPELLSQSPQIVRSARLAIGEMIVHGDEGSFEEGVIFSEPDLFNMFSFEVISGDPAAALSRPDGLVITREAALKHFGTVDLIGQPVALTNPAGRNEFQVLAVVESPPVQSTFQFRMVLPLQTHFAFARRELNWNSSNSFLLVETAGAVGKYDLDETFQAIVQKNKPDRAHVDAQGQQPTDRPYWNFYLLPFEDLHLSAQVGIGVDPRVLAILAAIAGLLLTIAIFNFVLLALGRLKSRFVEVGIRRMIGASRGNLTAMFLAEVLVTTLFALGLSFIILEFSLPAFNRLLGRELALGAMVDVGFWAAVVLLISLLVLAAGIFPALRLASMRPVQAMHGIDSASRKKGALRVGVIFQFSLAIFILVTALVFNSQMKFVLEQPLGFNQSQIVVYKIATEGEKISAWSQRLKEVLLRDRGVRSVTKTSVSVSRGFDRQGWYDRSKKFWRAVVRDVDESYLTTMEISLLMGRDFREQDDAEVVLVNQTFVDQFGLENPIGYLLDGFSYGAGTDPTIIGVVDDYNFSSLYSKVQPMMLRKRPAGLYSYLLARIAPDDVNGTLQRLADSWKNAAPGIPLTYNFLDEDIENLYVVEKKIRAVTQGAAILALALAAMGLLGMATIEVSRRTKEIGIRKVLGASVPDIMSLLSRRMVLSNLLANIIAWPIGWMVMQKWLGLFAYRIDLGLGTFVMAGLLALAIAVITVSTQAVRAATANPVDSLRYE